MKKGEEDEPSRQRACGRWPYQSVAPIVELVSNTKSAWVGLRCPIATPGSRNRGSRAGLHPSEPPSKDEMLARDTAFYSGRSEISSINLPSSWATGWNGKLPGRDAEVSDSHL